MINYSVEKMTILDFWHKLEFFIPFNLDNRLQANKDRKRVFSISQDNPEADLHRLHTFSAPEGKYISKVTLFAGIFCISELEIFAQELFPPPDEANTLDAEERGLSEGQTCYALFPMDSDEAFPKTIRTFNLCLEGAEISTLPWAMGHSLSAGLETLDWQHFQTSQAKLQANLDKIFHRHSSVSPTNSLKNALIGELAETLMKWAHYGLKKDNPLACIEIDLANVKEGTRFVSSTGKNIPSAEQSSEEPTKKELGILNSFFIEDIESAMQSVRQGKTPKLLDEYLTTPKTSDRIDLYSDLGKTLIWDVLHPDKMNAGRWLSSCEHSMSLMQQFAINSVIRMREKGGIFSVNGPPGTGKTTLLRDIIADNIVARANILASYKTSKGAFEKNKITIRFSNAESATISLLKPELTNFGMVVASSNNAAVENISRDLPKRQSVNTPKEFGYLQPVAHMLAARKSGGKFIHPLKDEKPWGLIACALGNSANRHHFRERVLYGKFENGDLDMQTEEICPKNLWDWVDSYNGPSFEEAARNYNEAKEKIALARVELEDFANLCAELSGRDNKGSYDQTSDPLSAAENTLNEAVSETHSCRKTLEKLNDKFAELSEDERLLKTASPPLWMWICFLAPAREHRAEQRKNAKRKIEINKHRRKLESDLEKRLAPAVAEAKLNLKEWYQKREKRDRMLSRGYKEPPADLEQDIAQVEGLWHLSEFAELRSELTQAALILHEAWLAEVCKSGGGFRGNLMAIKSMLSGQRLSPRQTDANIKQIWDSLFMIVPVVSTTFASYARQFKGMDTGSIEWLFIDEAGQAVPQAAVGALSRARTAIIIGDPLQIEPVFTLPPGLIAALANLSNTTCSGDWSPNQISVQSLADAANRYGAYVANDYDEQDRLWIGSPLRVHRRCIDPMFDLANHIAYQGKMVFGGAERLPGGDAQPYLGDSAWIDIAGRVEGRQKINGQIIFIRNLIIALHSRDGVLPEIFIISPFKEIVSAIKVSLREANWRYQTPKNIGKWLQKNVGTVHTFQGKEEDTVFFVLGVDFDHIGAAKWASSKPNLLNVALTRAKRRFYVIGEHSLWSSMTGFDLVAGKLQVVEPHVFLQKIQQRAKFQRWSGGGTGIRTPEGR